MATELTCFPGPGAFEPVWEDSCCRRRLSRWVVPGACAVAGAGACARACACACACACASSCACACAWVCVCVRACVCVRVRVRVRARGNVCNVLKPSGHNAQPLDRGFQPSACVRNAHGIDQLSYGLRGWLSPGPEYTPQIAVRNA